MKSIVSLFWTIQWIAGVVIAKGFWSTFFAVVTMGLWSAYIVTEKTIMVYFPGLLG